MLIKLSLSKSTKPTRACVTVIVSVRVCVCVRLRERETETDRQRKRVKEKKKAVFSMFLSSFIDFEIGAVLLISFSCQQPAIWPH